METTYLCGGIDWNAGGPVLSLHETLSPSGPVPEPEDPPPSETLPPSGPVPEDPALREPVGAIPGRPRLPGPERGAPSEPADDPAFDLDLASGTRLGFEIMTEGRFCLGFDRVHDREDRTHVMCADQVRVERGYQCGRCFAQDDLRFMHDVHRSGIAPPGLKRYLDQPHWLYVATFADGTSKVGTASHARKRARLVEQGAVLAQYVAYACDGRVVRLLEDEVTRSVGLQQAVRSGTKAASLCSPLPLAQLQDINDGFALAARGLLAGGMDVPGFEVVQEEFEPPTADVVLGYTGLQPYPEPLGAGRHGFTIREVLGPSALVSIEGADLVFVADLSQLRGRRLRLGDFTTAVPAVQESLF